MQNVISDPVFGLPEKRIQKENAKISPFGMLIWSIPKREAENHLAPIGKSISAE